MKPMLIVIIVVGIALAGLIAEMVTQPTASVISPGATCSDTDFKDGTGVQPMVRGTAMLYGLRGRLIQKQVDICDRSIVTENFCNPTGTNIVLVRIACAWGCDPNGGQCAKSLY